MRPALLLPVLVSATACGSSAPAGHDPGTGGSGGGEPPPACGLVVPAEEYALAFREALLGWYLRCGHVAPADADAFREAWGPVDASGWTARLAEGRVSYDGERWGCCVGRIAALGCDDPPHRTLAADPACDVPFEGTRAPGDACEAAFECRGGTCPTRRCEPRCVAWSAAGEACGEGCAAGLHCDPASGRCAAFVAAGNTCGDGAYCGPTLECLDPDGDGVRTCLRPGRFGTPCGPEHPSCPGVCLADRPTGEAVCAPAPGEGQLCAASPPGACGPGLVCDDTMRCVPRLPRGAACAFDPDVEDLCAAPYVCRASGLCEPPAAEGEACAGGRECAEGLCLDGRCGLPPPPSPGDACRGDDGCGPALICEGGRCAEGCRP